MADDNTRIPRLSIDFDSVHARFAGNQALMQTYLAGVVLAANTASLSDLQAMQADLASDISEISAIQAQLTTGMTNLQNVKAVIDGKVNSK